jgi:hypothetical protein
VAFEDADAALVVRRPGEIEADEGRHRAMVVEAAR